MGDWAGVGRGRGKGRLELSFRAARRIKKVLLSLVYTTTASSPSVPFLLSFSSSLLLRLALCQYP